MTSVGEVAALFSGAMGKSSRQQSPVIAMSHPVIMNQPQIVGVQRSDWQTGLFDCCEDCGVCLCGIFCTLCLGCQIASDMDECCLCGATMTMRSVYRTKYGIPRVHSHPAANAIGFFTVTDTATTISISCLMEEDRENGEGGSQEERERGKGYSTT
ncbi:hypothetical protein JRQ81_016941 [Phrynocephalus forsythii]|uniref:Placenta-specific gene 8 protein n=1 Tax=Phrynocephalus forsythii TaxID=171643 RepID=A0A9Q0XV65_9SAUR|nr:hypothetical protein JRQ81_016941 [Phrynocephalus forsythii]